MHMPICRSSPCHCFRALPLILSWLLAILALGTSSAQGAVSRLTGITLNESTNALVIDVVTTGPFNYRVMALPDLDLPRVAVDFLDAIVDNDLRGSTELNIGDVPRVRVIQFQEQPAIARLMIDFIRPDQIGLQRATSNVLVITVSRQAATAIRMKPSGAAPAPPNSSKAGAPGRVSADQIARHPLLAPLIITADQLLHGPMLQQAAAIGTVRVRSLGMRLAAHYAAIDLQVERLIGQGRVAFADLRERMRRASALVHSMRTHEVDRIIAAITGDIAGTGREGGPAPSRHSVDPPAPLPAWVPEQSPYLVTAPTLEVTPGDRLVAPQASHELAALGALTQQVLTISLQTPEETTKSTPRGGFDSVDGVWIDYEYKYSLGVWRGTLYSKFGTTSGYLPLNTLAYTRNDFGAVLMVGRNQDKDLNIYDQAELLFSISDRSLEPLPLLASFSLSEGWFREAASAVESWRLKYMVGLQMPPVNLSPQISWEASANWADASYDIGGRQGVMQIDVALTNQLNPSSSIKLGYNRLAVFGASPFLFDTVESDKLSETVSLEYSRTGVRGTAADASYNLGVSYSFLDGTISLEGGYRERASDRYHFGLTVEYDLDTWALKYTIDSGLAIGWGTYFTVQAEYKTETGQFKDLDYILTSRVDDCLDLELRYRQVRQEVFFVIDPHRCDPPASTSRILRP